MTTPLLTVDNLRIEAARTGEAVVDDISFDIARGEFLAVVGESGSGKTVAARTVLGLLPPGLRRTGGRIVLDGEDLATLSPKRLRALRGPEVGMVFQEPMVSLNPAISVGAQMAEGLSLHMRAVQEGNQAALPRHAGARPDPRSRAHLRRLSARILRRHAATDHAGLGDAAAAKAPDRRRADHRVGHPDPARSARPDGGPGAATMARR